MKSGFSVVSVRKSARTVVTIVLALILVACGGGGGGDSGGTPGGGTSGGNTAGQPTIEATAISFPNNALPPGLLGTGFNTVASVTVQNQAGTAPISTATVTLNGVALSYSASDQDYGAQLALNPGAPVNLSVTVGGVNYTATLNQFDTYPSIIAPAANTTWFSQASNLINWSGTSPRSTARFTLGLFDSIGNIVWPSADTMLTLTTDQHSYTINANVLSAGSRLLFVGIVDVASIAGATPGSGLAIGGFNFAPLTVSSTLPPANVTLQTLEVSPASLTLGIGKTSQATVTGLYSDGSRQDLTTRAIWTSSDPAKVTVSSSGLLTALLSGSVVVTAQYNGVNATATVTVFQPTPSPTPPLSQSVTYQIDYAHSGRATVGGTGPVFPPTATWSTTLNGDVSYPIVAGGKVIVMTRTNPAANGTSYGTSLYALDETNGAVVWGPIAIPGTYNRAGHAYDHGKVFVVNFDGMLRTFDASTGTAGWSRQLPGQYAFSSPPTAVNGVVYVGGAGSGGTLYAVDEATGNLLWTAGVANGDQSSPTVSSDGVYVSYPCQVYKFDPFSGAPLWHYAGPCSGGGGKTTALAGDRLYVRDPGRTNQIFDAATGAQVGTFVSTVIPAVSGQSAYYLSNGTLSAVDTTSQATRWTFMGDGGLQVAPIVIDSVVVIGSTTGSVYALNASTGAVLWTGQAGGAISGPDEQNVSAPLVGLAAGDGYLVVPAANVVKSWKIVP